MNHGYKVKYLVIAIVLAVVFIYLGFSRDYINIPGITPEKPYRVVNTPYGYAAGTTLNLYKKAPPGFPKEVILEDKVLKHSVLVVTRWPEVGEKSIKLSYISDQDLLNLATMYRDTLSKTDWVLEKEDISSELSVIQLSRGDEMLIITFTPSVEVGGDTTDTEVTFQYE